jgi:hypothetical protein
MGLQISYMYSSTIAIRTHPYSGHFGEKFIDLLVKQIARKAKASYIV